MVGVKRRTRVACRLCSSLKKKCNGKSPCKRCRERGVACEYSAARAHGPSAASGAVAAVMGNGDAWKRLREELGALRGQTAALVRQRDMLERAMRTMLGGSAGGGPQGAHSPYYTVCDYTWEPGFDDRGVTTTLYVSPALLRVIGGRVEDYVGDTMFQHMRPGDMVGAMLTIGTQWGSKVLLERKDTFTIHTAPLRQVIVAADGSRATEMLASYRLMRTGMTCRVVSSMDAASLKRVEKIPRTVRDEGGPDFWQGCPGRDKLFSALGASQEDLIAASLALASGGGGGTACCDDVCEGGEDAARRGVEVVVDKAGAEQALWESVGVDIGGGDLLSGGGGGPAACGDVWPPTAPLPAHAPPTPTLPPAVPLWDSSASPW